MQLSFEDHAGFQKAALLCVAGAMAGALASRLEAAAAGAAVALAIPALHFARQRRALALVSAVLTLLLARYASNWLPVAAACAGLSLALLRAERPSWQAALAAMALASGAAFLLPLADALLPLVPRPVAGAAFGLWLALAALPLHLVFGGDPVEARLASLRAALTPELRALAERGVAARRASLVELKGPEHAELRGTLETLALATLDVAARCAELGRATPPAAEEELSRRSTALTESAGATGDEAAKKSYLRAAEALQGQLDHLRRLRLARDRAVARLHEDTAQLERARFSLTLLRDPANAVELDLLHARLATPLSAAPGSEPC